MVTIVIAFFVGVLVSVICILCDARKKFVSTIFKLFLTVGIILGTIVPVSGYEDEEEYRRTVEFSPFSDTEYIKEDKYTYTYQYEVVPVVIKDDEIYVPEYVKKTILKFKGRIVKDPNCETPFINIYERKGKKTKWTFAILTNEEVYEFHIPST